MLESLPTAERRHFSDIFPKADAETLDFLEKLLQFNPSKRLNAEEALAHPYLKQFHMEADEPACSRPILAPMDDNRKFDAATYRERLYRDIKEEAKLAEEKRKKHYKKSKSKNESSKSSSKKKSKKSSSGL